MCVRGKENHVGTRLRSLPAAGGLDPLDQEAGPWTASPVQTSGSSSQKGDCLQDFVLL